ncbi:MAG: hypothetical protein ABJC09_07705 [Terriglobia bacterium]
MAIASWGANASANDVYLSWIAVGSANGSSCANTYAYTYFNAAANWTSGTPSGTQIGPGSTVHLCGTFTGSAGQQFFSAQGSGTSGNPITIFFEPNAVLQAPYISASSAIRVSGQSFITVDGGTKGLIQNTLNGTPGGACSGGACSYQQTSVAIQAFPCSSCEFRNLTIQNLYVHAMCEAGSGCDTAVDQTAVNAIQFGGSNVLIHDNVIHDVGWAFLEHAANGDSGDRIYNNTIYNMDHGAVVGAGPGITVPTLYIYNNHFRDMANWDTGTVDAYHHDGIHAFSTLNSGKIQNLYIYNNLFDGNQGNCCVTAWVFLEGGANAGSTPWTDSTGTAYLWNNVVIGSYDSGNGQISIGSGSGHQILNNTILGTNLGLNGSCLLFDTSSSNVTVENNAIAGCNQLLANGGPPPTSFALIDYNIYGGTVRGGNPVFNFASHNSSTFAGWQSACGCDSHSAASLGTTFATTIEGVPQSGFVGTGAGVNLSASATGNVASLLSDTSAGGTRKAIARPPNGPWDVGAYRNYNGAPPNPPTLLTTTVQ